MVFVVIMILTLFVLMIGCTGIVLYRWGKSAFCGLSPLWFGLLFGAITAFILALFILSRTPNNTIPRGLIKFGHYGLGVFLYTVMFVDIMALVLLIVCLLLGRRPSVCVNTVALIFCTVLVIGFSAYGMIHANTIRTVSYPITVNKKTSPVKIALISDLHMGYIMDEHRLQTIVNKINHMQPDMLCIAGDIFDGDMTSLSDLEAIRELFRSVKAPVYACLGNHDAGETYIQMLNFLEEAGVRVLLDEAVTVDGRVLLAGRRDSSPIGGHEGERTKLPALSSDNTLPVVVMDHQPGNIGEYSDDVDLILCGHTHRGQLFPGNLVTRRMFTVDYGYYRATKTSPQVIVTSGVGTWGPVLRVGSDCEIVEITISADVKSK